MSPRAVTDGWARLNDAERLDRAVKVAREGILSVLANLDPDEREAIYAEFRRMTPAERDEMIRNVMKAEGLTDALVDDVTRISREKAGVPRDQW